MSSGKKKLAIFFLLLLILAIPATSYIVFKQTELRSQAEPATTLAFDPTSTSKTVGETFTLSININTGSNSVSGAELHIQYDAQKLDALSIDNASVPFLPVVLVDGSANNGFAFITLGSQPSSPKKGSGVIATITFRALSSTQGAPTLVKFTTDTRIAGTGEVGNVLASQPAPASITINPATTPTPSPTPTVLPTPTTAGGGGGGGGGGLASPTPRGGNVGIGSTIPTAKLTPSPIGGVISPLPTAGPIPVTADLGPTVVITAGGIVLFIAGMAALLIL